MWCQRGPQFFLGAHKNVLISFKVRREKMNFLGEECAFLHDINIFFFISMLS